MDMVRSRAHLIVKGRVQGVFYRSTSKNRAQEYLLTGWVKNKPDGTVEIVVEGDKDNIEKFIEWAHEGSASAQVDKVEVIWSNYTGDFKEYNIKHF